jgi:hypothetical protein
MGGSAEVIRGLEALRIALQMRDGAWGGGATGVFVVSGLKGLEVWRICAGLMMKLL